MSDMLASSPEAPSLMSVRDLAVHIRTDAGLARILDGVSFTLPPGGSLGIVGESGCGKSTLLRAILGILPKGALVPQGLVIPPRSLVAGVPGKVRRELSDAEVANNRHNAAVYEGLVELHREAI